MENNIRSMESTFEEQVESVLKTLSEMTADRYGGDADDYLQVMKKNYQVGELDTHWAVGTRKLAAKIINRKLATLKKMTDAESFIDKFNQHQKFLIVAEKTKNLEVQVRELENIELFTIRELERNISKHVQVPKHILLTEEQAKKLLEEYDIDKLKLPKIYDTDPMVKYIGGKVADVVEIVRSSMQSGMATIYRVVIPDPGN